MNNQPFDFRMARSGEVEQVLGLIEELDFNPRDIVTWNALNMSAATAWKGTQLVGAIPLEPRTWKLGGKNYSSLHETVVGVLDGFQGQGVGSRLQKFLTAEVFNDVELLTTLRDDPLSGAYRWYVQNGFHSTMSIASWKLKIEAGQASGTALYSCIPWTDPDIAWGELEQHRKVASGHVSGGHISRSDRQLNTWLPVHPYRNQMDFKVLTLDGEHSKQGFALIGINELGGNGKRVEILELNSTVEDADIITRFLDAVIGFAASQDINNIRWAVASSDRNTTNAVKLRGFKTDWSFDLLALPLGNAKLPDQSQLATMRYHSVDYI